MNDPQIVPGTVIVHSDGLRRIIERRKRDNTGWWLTDGSGVADNVLGLDWRITAEVAAFAPIERCRHCDKPIGYPNALAGSSPAPEENSDG